ncbi:MAG: alanine racemase [Bauldia sp.]|nr:alanine racemase [Bauldia sp.]
MTFNELDTPALLVDVDVLEGNVERVVGACRRHGVNWRPHIKAHKSVDIARKLIAHGAIGITCAKLGEAEVMAAAGIGGIVIANQIVGPIKIGRLVQLLATADPIVCVDDAGNVEALAAAVGAAGRRLGVLIEVDTGMHRAGVEAARVPDLARKIAAHPELRFAGLLTWEAHTVTIADPAAKAAAVKAAVSQLTASADACRAIGLDPEIVSCGGTGTFPHSIEQPGITEVQVGGAIFCDKLYRDVYHVDLPFALSLLTTVTSRPTPTRIIVDAGKKAMSGDVALPEPIGLPPVASIRLSAEHTTIELAAPSATPRVGDQLAFVVGYSDTTIHLHEEIVAVRNGAVIDRWPVSARGRIK